MVFHAILQYTQDLKTVIVCASDAAYVNATHKNSNGCLNQFFGNINGRPRFCSRDGNPLADNGRKCGEHSSRGAD